MTLLWVAVFLGVVNLLVVCGNFFVLYILISQKQLHTSTNFIVLSLTVSDFLLGIIVLPFSIFQEYSASWLFGDVWCKAWLALDVLLSTASIYNLLAISFDRYMHSLHLYTITFGQLDPAIHGNLTEIMGLPQATQGYGECTPMTSNNLYILFSAFVSFIMPMFLMIGLNLSIFHTVNDSRKLTTIQSNGTCTSVSNLQYCGTQPNNGSIAEESASWMRIHRGGAKNSAYSTKTSDSNSLMAQRSASMSAAANFKKFSVQRDASSAVTPNIRPKPSLPSTRKTTFDNGFSHSLEKPDNFSLTAQDTQSCNSTIGVSTANEQAPMLVEGVEPKNAAHAWWIRRMKKSPAMERKQVIVECDQQSFHSVATLNSATTPTQHYTYNPLLIPAPQKTVVDNVWYPALLTSILATSSRQSTPFGKKSGERLLVYPMIHQLSRFNLRTELRVARTIGVVVGCFSICWLPFTIIYVLQAFETCSVGMCIPSWLFTLAFWLGYANSAINPLLYAAFSRDFRCAFRKVLMDRNSSFRSY
ncbi:hypothetical protein M3Y97_00674800 [Aphelenchoides bicaudatus]|nr:hypothetical protein M3Y97_00674800 [Aphelenchoides bicaudatus]